jgi:hypothetical protein
MAFWDISQLAADNDFIQRTRACVASEGEPDPVGWSNDHMWQMAGTPGFGDKYSYAINTGVENPGRNESVITDGDILSAVQAIQAGVE